MSHAPRTPRTIHFPGQMILLGTGTSVGVPTLGCDCQVCTGGAPKNQRLRTAAVLGLPEGNLLIDTPPDLRTQLLREGVGLVHTVIFTHEHADHLYGLDDLRLFQFYLDSPLPIYCEAPVARRIHAAYDYAFSDTPATHVGARPQLAMRPLDTRPFAALGVSIQPIRLKHGPDFDVLGFRIGNVAYCTDTNEIPAESWGLLEGLDVLVLDALRRKPHPTHFCLDEAVAAAQRIGAKRTVFTHISHDLDHESTNRELPPTMELGYDGMRLPLS